MTKKLSSFPWSVHWWVYATGRQEEEEGKTLVCDKRDRAISHLFCRDLHLTSMFSGLSQKDLFKGKWSLAKSCFKQNYCHACHTRFVVFFPLPSCCVSSLLSVGAKSHPVQSIWRQSIQLIIHAQSWQRTARTCLTAQNDMSLQRRPHSNCRNGTLSSSLNHSNCSRLKTESTELKNKITG